MRRIYVVLIALMAVLLVCGGAALLGSRWAQIADGSRPVREEDVLASIAILFAPFLAVYLVRFERRVRVDGRGQLAALERLFPGAVIFTTQAVPETATALTRIRGLQGMPGPVVRADHRVLTVTVSRYDVSVWDGRHEPRRLVLIPARDIVGVSPAETPVIAGLDRQRMLPSVAVWSGNSERLVLPMLVVRPRVVKPSAQDVAAVVDRIGQTLQIAQFDPRLP
jgi:hypothetical protein